MGSAEPGPEPLKHSWAPVTAQGHDDGQRRGVVEATDGDLKTYWKSNPYLTKDFTGESDSLHAQWSCWIWAARWRSTPSGLPDKSLRAHVLGSVLTGPVTPLFDNTGVEGNPRSEHMGTWKTFPMGKLREARAGRLRTSFFVGRYLGEVAAYPDDGVFQCL